MGSVKLLILFISTLLFLTWCITVILSSFSWALELLWRYFHSWIVVNLMFIWKQELKLSIPSSFWHQYPLVLFGMFSSIWRILFFCIHIYYIAILSLYAISAYFHIKEYLQHQFLNICSFLFMSSFLDDQMLYKIA